MVFEWNDFYSLADKLRKEDDEASKRSAISRAYYCVFHKAKDYAERNLNYVFRPDQASHMQMWRCFSGKGQTSQAVFNKGSSLCRHRTSADYHNPVENIDRILGFAFDDAEKALYWLDKLDGQK